MVMVCQKVTVLSVNMVNTAGEAIIPPKLEKKLFLSLFVGAFCLISLLTMVMWKIAYLGLAEIQQDLPLLIGAVLGIVFLFALLGVINLFFSLKGWKFPIPFRGKTYAVVNFLYPVVVLLGKVLKIDLRRIEASFVAVSNQIVRNTRLKVPADRLLVVTPHCLQKASCPHKITRDPNNCKRCGGCDVGAMVTLAEEMGFNFFVVTGGTLARQIVKKLRPKAVLAVACERDLTSGIQDVYPLPAVGVMNIRPNGPCYNTHVDMEDFKRQLEEIIEKPND